MPKRAVIVVGGSLVGLAAALALQRQDWAVTVIERSSLTTAVGGSGIGINRALLSKITGINSASFPVIEKSFEQTTWALVYEALMRRALSIREITLRANSRVVSADDSGEVTVETTEGRKTLRADLVLGADGHASFVRGVVDPQRKHSQYAGYMMWRGLIEEKLLSTGFRNADLAFSVHYLGSSRLVTFGVPGVEGETNLGRRRASFSWFDTGRRPLLESMDLLCGNVVRGALSASNTPSDVASALLETALRWPTPWGPAISGAIRRLEFVGTPISEYYPARLVRGRAAILGDAAHVVSPITGAGFHNGLLDVGALAKCLRAGHSVSAALEEFERQRLPEAQELVRESQEWSRAFLRASI